MGFTTPLAADEEVLMEVLAAEHPGDWLTHATERLGVPHFVASSKIAAYIEKHAIAWLAYRTLYSLAESLARLASIQTERHRLARGMARYEAELQEVIDGAVSQRPKKGLRNLLDSIGTPAPPSHLDTLAEFVKVHGGGVYNYSKLIDQERKEAEYRDRLLDRLKRELDANVPKTKMERVKAVHDLAITEGRFGEGVRLIGMMQAEGSTPPTMDSMRALADSLAARLRGDAV